MTLRMTDRSQIEDLVDRLAQAVHEADQPGQVTQELLASLSPLTGALASRLWIWVGGVSAVGENGVPENTTASSPRPTVRGSAMAVAIHSGAILARYADPAADDLREVANLANSVKPQLLEPVPQGDRSETGAAESVLRWMIPVRKSSRTLAVLEFLQPGKAVDPLPLASVVAELLADLLLDQEVRQLRLTVERRQKEQAFFARLATTSGWQAAAQLIAQEVRGLVGCDRVAVLQFAGKQARLLAVSGVADFDRRSPEVRQLEAMAQAESQVSVKERDPRIQLITDLASGVPIAAVVLEKFETEVDRRKEASLQTVYTSSTKPAGINSESLATREALELAEILRNWQGLEAVVSSILRQQLLVETIPLASFWLRASREFKTLSLRRQVRRVMLFALFGGVVASLFLISGELQMTGQGAVWPRERRHVFAPHAGRVEQIHVNQGSIVKTGDLLATLHNPEMELESTRLQGEILTLEKQIEATRSARVQLSSGNSDQAAKAAELSAQELGFEQQLQSRREELSLVKQAMSELQIRSPMDGEIMTWDPQQTLAGRPVERGQILLDLGDTQGEWVVDVRVTDQSMGHILSAYVQSPGQGNRPQEKLPAEFVLTTRPEETHTAYVESISESVERDEMGQLYLRLVLGFDRQNVSGLRPGATAVPRIHCGRAPLAYVWLHDLIDRIRLWWQF